MTDLHNYINQKKELIEAILLFIDDLDGCFEFPSLQNIIIKQKISDNKHELSSLLHLILKIANNRHRSPDFFKRITQILKFLKTDINELQFSNEEIYTICQSNKLISLIFIDEKILVITESIKDRIIMNRHRDPYYPIYFYLEIEDFLSENEKKEIKNEYDKLELSTSDFDLNRRIGENDAYICELIRDDLVEDFITLMNRKNIPFNSRIEPSVFETNRFLIKNKPSLIEYAAFYGSIQIFKYLYLCRNDLLKPSVWNYVIHGRNPELVHFLEENSIQTIDNHFIGILNESIKCHHNEIADYFLNNFLYDDQKDESYYSSILKSYNYSYFPSDLDNSFIFFHLCKNDYFNVIKDLEKSENSKITFQTDYKNSKISTINIAMIKENNEIVNRLWNGHKKQIDSNEYKNCSCLNLITIPNSITHICDHSFFSSSIKLIKIPESVIEIGKSSFENCTLLRKIELPSKIKIISNCCFKNCKCLQKVSIPSTIKSIGKNAFDGCSSLTDVSFIKVNENNDDNDKDSFERLSEVSVNDFKNINDFQNIIDDFAFNDCSSLKKFVIPSNVRKIGKNCFCNCSSLKEVVFHDDVSSIGWKAFYHCNSLEKLINFKAKSIGNSSFEGCTSLSEIKIPDNVNSINWRTFADCVNLQNVIVPSSVTVIGEYAFCNCRSLKKIKITGNLSSIKKSAFQDCYLLDEASIPSTIKLIDKYAFQGCKMLKSIFIPLEIKSVGYKAFEATTNVSKYLNHTEYLRI